MFATFLVLVHITDNGQSTAARRDPQPLLVQQTINGAARLFIEHIVQPIYGWDMQT